MSDRVGIQSKKTTSATSTPLTVIPPTRSFTPPTHAAQAQAKTQAPTQEVEHPSGKQETPDLQAQLTRASRCGHNFGRMQARIERPSVIQPKLTIGKPGDKYEQEADRVADNVMAMPAPKAQPKIQSQTQEEELQTKSSDGIPPSIQLQAEEEEQLQTKVNALAPLIQRQEAPQEEEIVQTKCIANSITPQVQRQPIAEEELVQTKADPITPLIQQQEASQEDEQLQAKPLQQESSPTYTRQDSPSEDCRLTAQKGNGSPMSNEARAFMEPRFGVDFSQVKIHTNSSAIQMNKELSAQAFTHGNDIYFGAGKYNPGTSDGKQLLAHELTHVVQQTGAKQLQRQPITNLGFNKETPHKVQPSPSLHSPQCATIQRFQENPQSQTPGDNKANKERKTPNSASATAKSNTSGSGAAPTLTQKGENGAATAPAKEKGDKRDGNAIARALEGSESSGIATAAKAQSGSDATSAKPHSDNSGAVPDNTGANVSAPGTKNAQLKSPACPEEDPAFQSVVNQVKGVAKQEKQHDSAQAESKEAQDAAQPPGNEVESKAQDRQVGEMNQQQPGTFNAAAFKAALMQKIAAVIPNNEQDAKKFKQSNQLDWVKQDMSSEVSQEQEQAAGPIEEKAKEAPNTSGIEPKPVSPLQSPETGAAPTNIGAQQATPKPKPESEVSAPLKANSQELDQQMAEAHITEGQLEKSNEPQFQETLGAKKEAQANAVEAPQAYRQTEQTTLNKAQAEAQTTSQTQLQLMHGGREQLLTQVMGAQSETQGKDTQERAKIAGEINGIYEETKGKVENVLSTIDTEVKSKFDAGAAAAKQKFEAHIGKEMEAWEQKRYGEWYDVTGWDERVSDAWLGLPPEVNKFFVDGRQLYLDSIDVTLTEIANFVAQKLNEAKQKIAEGKQKIQAHVAGLPENLRQVGQEAAQNIEEKFKQLEDSVNSKQDELIDSLAQKYSENLQQLDADIEKRKEANRGLKDKAKDAIAGTIQTIMQLKDMLMGVLAKAAGAIDKIILDPIAFLGNLVAGVKQGFMNFVGKIWEHLKKGLLGWLTGTLAAGGIQMPESFDLKGIFTLVMQVLGLAYDAIKSRAVKALGKNGEKIFTALETTFEIFIILKNEGLAGLWKFIQDKIGDLKVMVVDTIQTFVIENVIKQGVLWVISLLNPASAFVKACKMIYDIVMFFIERGSQIVELVNAVMESVSAIASGAVGGAAKIVENALAASLPVVISFMASLLGLGGISEKIQGIIKQVRAPIDKAIDWLIAQAVQFAKKIGNKLGFGKKDEKSDPEHDKKVQAGLNTLHQDEVRYAKDGKLSLENARKVAADVKRLHPVFKSIIVLDGGNAWKYHYVASPGEDETSKLGKAGENGNKIRRENINIDEKIDDKNTYWTVRVSAKVGDRRISLGKGVMELAKPEDYIFVADPEAEKYEYEQEGTSLKEVARGVAEEVYEKAKKIAPGDISSEINRTDILVKGPKTRENKLEINLYAKVADREVWWGDAVIDIDTETGALLLDTKSKVVYAQKIEKLKIRGGPGFTEVAQEEMDKAWEEYAKMGPLKKIEASLSADNKSKFQAEFIRLKTANPSLDDRDIAQQAVHATPLATGRKAKGFTKFVVTISNLENKNGIQVPNIIHVVTEK